MTPSSLAEHKYEKGVYKTPMNSIPFMTPMEKNETFGLSTTFYFLFDINMIIYYIYICIVLTMVEQAGNEKTSQYRGSVQITQPFVF